MRGAAYERFYVALVLTVAFVFVLSATVRLTSGALEISNWIDTVTAPANTILSRAAWDASQATAFATGLFDAERKVVSLEKANASLRFRLLQAESADGQMPQLRRLLKLSLDPSVYNRTIAANVVSRAPATWFDAIRIDRGSRDGIATGDAVLGPGGLAGRVVGVAPDSATVLLLPDPQSAVGATDARSREVGVISGDGSPTGIQMQFYSGAASVRKGDAVVTSGLTGHEPKGLPIGIVVSVRSGQFGLVREATVRPLVNFDQLEYVLVVVKP